MSYKFKCIACLKESIAKNKAELVIGLCKMCSNNMDAWIAPSDEFGGDDYD